MTTTLDPIWQAVAANPTDADAKRQLASALGDTHAGIGLMWCASHGKHPKRIAEGYCWCEANPAHEDEPGSIHHFIFDSLSRMNWWCRPEYAYLSDAFHALGAVLKELREVVGEER